MAKPIPKAEASTYVRPMLYPVQLVLLVTQEVGDRIARESVEGGRSKAEVGRALIDAGIAVADYEAAQRAKRSADLVDVGA